MKRHLKNNKGFLTLDYLFAFVLVMGFGGIMFALSMTLTVVEVTQYITFSAARAYYAGDVHIISQRSAGMAKYDSLVKNPAFASLYSGSWFEVPKVAQVTNIGRALMQKQQWDSDIQNVTVQNMFLGFGVDFNAKMLDFNIPFYGPTASEDGGFKTFIASYMGREVDSETVRLWSEKRWLAIQDFTNSASQTDAVAGGPGGYVRIDDNGF